MLTLNTQSIDQHPNSSKLTNMFICMCTSSMWRISWSNHASTKDKINHIVEWQTSITNCKILRHFHPMSFMCSIYSWIIDILLPTIDGFFAFYLLFHEWHLFPPMTIHDLHHLVVKMTMMLWDNPYWCSSMCWVNLEMFERCGWHDWRWGPLEQWCDEQLQMNTSSRTEELEQYSRIEIQWIFEMSSSACLKGLHPLLHHFLSCSE